MKRLYAHMVAPGDLVFDIGAHAGNRTRSLAAMGCRVVALEPQPDFARLLRRLFARAPRVTVVEAAVGRAAGTATLAVSQRNPTVTTISSSWRKARAADPAFAGVEWNRSLEVPVTTRALVPGSADGGGGVIGCDDASEMINVTVELLRRGYPDSDIAKIWSGNLLRVLDQVQQVAQQLQAGGAR